MTRMAVNKYFQGSLYLGLLSSLIGVTLSEVNLFPRITDTVQYVNDSFIVTCLDVANQTVSWKKDRVIGEKGHPFSRTFGHARQLVFERITGDDRGTYTCNTQHESVSFKLIAIAPISFMDTPSIQTARENHSASIKCDVSGDPKPKVLWKFEGNTLPSEKYSIQNGNLQLKNVSLEDNGTFTCRAYQVSIYSSMMKDKNIRLIVKHKPIPAKPTKYNVKHIYGHVGGEVNLTCEAIANPAANFTWLLKSKQTITARIIEKPNLSILQVYIQNESMFGDYLCLVANELGILKQIITLQEGVRPSVPVGVKFRGATSDTIRIEIAGPSWNQSIPLDMQPTGFRLQYRLQNAGGGWAEARYTKSEDHKYTISRLNHNAMYEIRGATENLAGVSDFTAPVTGRTLDLQADSMLSRATCTISAYTPLVTMLALWPVSLSAL